MQYLKMILGTLIVPPAGPLLLIIAALLWRSRPRLGRALALAGAASLWLLSTLPVANALERLAEGRPALSPARATTTGAQAIVILGGGGERDFAPEYGGPAADAFLLERLAYGAWLARRTSLPVLVTGHSNEAAAMRATLERNFGIRPRWVDEQAFDTFDNARDSARILHPAGIERILLVSSADHLRRASREFASAGFAVVAAPVHVWAPSSMLPSDYLPGGGALEVSSQALHELIGEPVRAVLAWTGMRRQDRD